MLTKNINFKNFRSNKLNKKIKNFLIELIKEDNEILNSLKSNYKDKFSKRSISKLKNFSEFLVIGMGGSILGSRSIFNFLRQKIKKDFYFIDDLEETKLKKRNKKSKQLNLVISKSGNTLETLSNFNNELENKNKNIFITEDRSSDLTKIAEKLKSEIIHHNNFIGGRYSVLSEVGMLPAELMGLKVEKFRKFNSLIKNKRFVNSLIQNVSSTLEMVKNNKINSIILNYDKKSSDLFLWYQQLIAESLGKKGKGILPIISYMPSDNHSLMQFYLDGVKNNFFTFFYVDDISKKKIKHNDLLFSFSSYLKNKKFSDIKKSQFNATQKVFKRKKIPFRSFVIKNRTEESLGELFVFFILETILLGKALKVNPYDQPAVELIKSETKKFLSKI